MSAGTSALSAPPPQPSGPPCPPHRARPRWERADLSGGLGFGVGQLGAMLFFAIAAAPECRWETESPTAAGGLALTALPTALRLPAHLKFGESVYALRRLGRAPPRRPDSVSYR